MFLKKRKRPDGSHFHLYLSQRQANSPVYALQNSSKQQIKTEYTSVNWNTHTLTHTVCGETRSFSASINSFGWIWQTSHFDSNYAGQAGVIFLFFISLTNRWDVRNANTLSARDCAAFVDNPYLLYVSCS